MHVDVDVIKEDEANESVAKAQENPFRLYDSLIVQTKRVGNDTAHTATLNKYSQMIDVYKRENTLLRFRLETAETALKTYYDISEIFKT